MTVIKCDDGKRYVIPDQVVELFQLPIGKSEWTDAELLGLVFSEDVEGTAAAIEECIKSGKPIDIEFRVVGKDNCTRWVRCHSVPSALDRPGESPYCWIVQDISSYRNQMTNLSMRLEARNRELMSVNQSLTEFAYALSHDLKRPVRHIHSFAELAKEASLRGEGPEGLRFIDKILHASSSMANLIDRLLNFSHMGHRSLVLEEVDQHEMIAILMQQRIAQDKSINIEWKISGDMPVAFVDRILWQTLWMNLIDNAIKYSRVREIVRVEFSAEMVGNRSIYRISDNGIGFDPAQSKRMFEVFQRLTSDERFEGSGIGLAQAQRIIQAHDGDIQATSQPGHGATFEVTLPLSGQHASSDGLASTKAPRALDE